MNNTSKLLENAIEHISQLPGIGKRTAMRLALWLLDQDAAYTENLAQALLNMKHNIKYCDICHNLSDDDICYICTNPKRNANQICVVADVRDVMAIENIAFYKGYYHVLGGLISPIDGISPKDLNIDSLLRRLDILVGDESTTTNNTDIEVILAISGTMDGSTTQMYLQKILSRYNISLTTIARGISAGEELEYTDEMSLITSFRNRVSL